MRWGRVYLAYRLLFTVRLWTQKELLEQLFAHYDHLDEDLTHTCNPLDLRLLTKRHTTYPPNLRRMSETE
jgi:hypothetical protein